MMTTGEKVMTKEELVKAISSGIFADRATLDDAFEYVAEVAKKSGNSVAVWTAVMVMANTIANEVKGLKETA